MSELSPISKFYSTMFVCFIGPVPVDAPAIPLRDGRRLGLLHHHIHPLHHGNHHAWNEGWARSGARHRRQPGDPGGAGKASFFVKKLKMFDI